MIIASDQERTANQLAKAMIATALPILDATQPPVPLDALEPEDIDEISALSQLGQALPEFCRRAALNDLTPVHWDRMAENFDLAATICREHGAWLSDTPAPPATEP